MMIMGIGTDIVEIARIQRIVSSENRDDFLKKIFTPKEIAIISKKEFCARFIAKRWAGKEACIKAMDAQISWHDVQIFNTSTGQPFVECSDRKIMISLSDESAYAIAYTIVFA